MKLQITAVSVGQTAKGLAILYMIMALPFLLVGALFGSFRGNAGAIVLAVVIAPLIYGALAYLCTGLLAWLYNLVARRVGGMEYSVEEMPDTRSDT